MREVPAQLAKRGLCRALSIVGRGVHELLITAGESVDRELAVRREHMELSTQCSRQGGGRSRRARRGLAAVHSGDDRPRHFLLPATVATMYPHHARNRIYEVGREV